MTNLMTNLQRALEIAVESHKHKKQKDGTPYALHPIRLSMSLQSEERKIVALLHDVVEDTDCTFKDLVAEGFSDDVIEALRLPTHSDGSPYEDYVQRLASNPLAMAVKEADLIDNMDITWSLVEAEAAHAGFSEIGLAHFWVGVCKAVEVSVSELLKAANPELQAMEGQMEADFQEVRAAFYAVGLSPKLLRWANRAWERPGLSRVSRSCWPRGNCRMPWDGRR